MTRMRLAGAALLVFLVGFSGSVAGASPPAARRLEITNRFATAEETLGYFIGRDGAGFVWSGFLESERREFTTWKTSPAHDSFYLAKSVSLKPIPAESHRDQQVIDATYQIDSIRDAAGTRTLPRERTRTVRFVLKRIDGKWKVAAPDSGQFIPVLLADQVRRDLPSR